MHISFWAALVAVGVAGCAPGLQPTHLTVPLPQTRAEQTRYTETSTYGDVQAFLNGLRASNLPLAFGSIGTTTEGRAIPYVIASRPLVRTPGEARALGRPVVYVNANIHAGEVEGKEAILALVRDLAASHRPNVLDSVVLVAVPIYNADGNEQFASQAVNRPEQFGPERVGRRPNAQGLDLNRDYIKAETPETRASLAMFAAWDPDVYVDLHTTDGSYHHFALTYAPSLNPAAYTYGRAGGFMRDTMLPELRQTMHTRGFETFDYGNFALDEERDITDTVKQGWYSYDHRPRFGTNYYGLRSRVSILSEAYSHDPFERRVKATYAFVSSILSASARRADALARIRSDTTWPSQVPVRSKLTTRPFNAVLAFEILQKTGDSLITEAGVPPGIRRTGQFKTQRMPVYDRFEPTLNVPVAAAYVLLPGNDSAVSKLRQHGLTIAPISRDTTISCEEFVIQTVSRDYAPFQGHRASHVTGSWRQVRRVVPAGSTIVNFPRRLGAVAAYLLDPESDDGLLNWNFFDAQLGAGGTAPVLRLF